ncbi:hypothetical protein A6770_04170 [Nostoc minutum NIES-26]|uniref:Uncharacterized protein n=1 Tax=Nostoc minutum NIES-26 TaxID=1844469 RepID=A0A367QCC9_9NOSO|nr:hypothetical protein A6770_04170 [Nostoc minutum NIES-26]
MSQKSNITSIAIPESSDNHQVVDLTNLQYDIAALAEYEGMLTKLQKQRIRYNLQCEYEQGIQELSWLVERINTLSAQLETEMFKFKQIAVKTNKAYWAIQQPPNFSNKENLKLNYRIPHSIWQIHSSVIPIVSQRDGVFFLTTKTVDLFLQSQEINPEKLAKESQKRRQSLESWLLKMHEL